MLTSEIGTSELERLVVEARERQRRAPARRERLVRGSLVAVFFGAATALAVLGDSARDPHWWAYPAAVVAYAVVSSIKIELGSGVALPTELVLVPMLFVLPAENVPLVVAAAMFVAVVPDLARRRLSPQRAVVWTANSFFSLGPALVFVVAGQPPASPRGGVVLAIAVVAQFLFDGIFTLVTETVALGVHGREVLASLAGAFTIDALIAPVAFGLTLANEQAHGMVLLQAPLLGLLLVFARERRRRLDSFISLSTAYRGTAMLLGDVVEADDAYTGEHSKQVLELVLDVARRLGLGERELRLAEMTALLHDVGKIRIPNEIINKPSGLTPEERAVIDTHTIEGERLLEPVGGLLAEVGSLVRSCHERWDGLGYPDGLAGEKIPLVARIVCACDAFNAMTTDRPYRAALSQTEALAELMQCRGTHFDPGVVDALLEVVGPRREAQRLGACPDCGRSSLLAEPTADGRLVCLHCGLVGAAAA
jgi:HD-GYP domain-containing protein (c-di-GMP phosphodiesterase class II)